VLLQCQDFAALYGCGFLLVYTLHVTVLADIWILDFYKPFS